MHVLSHSPIQEGLTFFSEGADIRGRNSVLVAVMKSVLEMQISRVREFIPVLYFEALKD